MFAQLLQSLNIILTNSVGPEQTTGMHSGWSPSTLAENALRDIFFINWLKYIFKIWGLGNCKKKSLSFHMLILNITFIYVNRPKILQEHKEYMHLPSPYVWSSYDINISSLFCENAVSPSFKWRRCGIFEEQRRYSLNMFWCSWDVSLICNKIRSEYIFMNR